MAIKQSAWGKGNRTAVRPQTAGAVHATRFVYDFGVEGAVAATDILELAVIPPYARLVDAKIALEGAFTGTADIGVMTGTFGDATDAARTSGAQLFAAADLTEASKLLPLAKAEGLLLPASEIERGIGVKFSAAQAATAGKRITLILEYVQ